MSDENPSVYDDDEGSRGNKMINDDVFVTKNGWLQDITVLVTSSRAIFRSKL
jgi:hypothetical protein